MGPSIILTSFLVLEWVVDWVLDMVLVKELVTVLIIRHVSLQNLGRVFLILTKPLFFSYDCSFFIVSQTLSYYAFVFAFVVELWKLDCPAAHLYNMR